MSNSQGIQPFNEILLRQFIHQVPMQGGANYELENNRRGSFFRERVIQTKLEGSIIFSRNPNKAFIDRKHIFEGRSMQKTKQGHLLAIPQSGQLGVHFRLDLPDESVRVTGRFEPRGQD